MTCWRSSVSRRRNAFILTTFRKTSMRRGAWACTGCDTPDMTGWSPISGPPALPVDLVRTRFVASETAGLFHREGHGMRRTAFAALCIIFLLSAAAPQVRRPIELHDLFAMKRVGDPALSPDGKWVAYTLTTVDLEKNTSSSDLWLSSLDGATSRPLTTHPSADRNPAWSPDGNTLAFESTRSGESQVWLLELSTGEPRQLTHIATGAREAVWSPDGSLLAFLSDVWPEHSARPFAVSDSLNRARLLEGQKGGVTARVYTRLLERHWDRWSDGRRVHLFVQPVSGGDPRDLTPGDRDAVPTSSTFSGGVDFAFSPDGREIAFTATPTPPHSEAWSTNYDILVVPVTGGAPVPL